MNTLLGIAVLKHSGQTGHGAGDGHISITAPDDVLCLLPEAAFLGTAVALSQTAVPRQIQPAHCRASVAAGSCRQSMNIQTGAPGLQLFGPDTAISAAQRVQLR